MVTTLLTIVAVSAVLYAAASQYLRWYFRWETKQTSGMAYYGRCLPDRRALKQRMRWLSLPVRPFVRLLGLANRNLIAIPTFEYGGVCGPPKVSSPEVFESAKNYRPRSEDVFVATQMRCGTTWMQQLVFQIVTRGRGDLTDRGFGHLYAVSPWIDGLNAVPLEDAPLVGEKPTRIIKTHLPTTLCPYSSVAKYIYVTRHPVSCFASIVDYNRSLLGPLTPPVDVVADWFCSDRMYWSSWPQHVEGWWRWAQSHENVLFVRFEDMIDDFDRVQNIVARFLGYTLTDDERRLVARSCSFKYMKDHEELFEMAPPTMFSIAGGEYLKSGKQSRHEDVAPETRARILDYCRMAFELKDCPAERSVPGSRRRSSAGAPDLRVPLYGG